MPMKNNDKAFLWSCNDFSDEVAGLEKLCARFQTVESNQSHSLIILIDANNFKTAFEAARKFNNLVREEKLEELEYAPAIEDIEEKVEDDIDKNKTHGEDGAADEAEGDDN